MTRFRPKLNTVGLAVHVGPCFLILLAFNTCTAVQIYA